MKETDDGGHVAERKGERKDGGHVEGDGRRRTRDGEEGGGKKDGGHGGDKEETEGDIADAGRKLGGRAG